uniref:Mid2 domain-containing protein n=1 Tax=Mycena chlorophos TaxID=658473 RepID=A0ABQ0M8N7_MYCCL|nr:predicted protein [Mycena chlorophos]
MNATRLVVPSHPMLMHSLSPLLHVARQKGRLASFFPLRVRAQPSRSLLVLDLDENIKHMLPIPVPLPLVAGVVDDIKHAFNASFSHQTGKNGGTSGQGGFGDPSGHKTSAGATTTTSTSSSPVGPFHPAGAAADGGVTRVDIVSLSTSITTPAQHSTASTTPTEPASTTTTVDPEIVQSAKVTGAATHFSSPSSSVTTNGAGSIDTTPTLDGSNPLPTESTPPAAASGDNLPTSPVLPNTRKGASGAFTTVLTLTSGSSTFVITTTLPASQETGSGSGPSSTSSTSAPHKSNTSAIAGGIIGGLILLAIVAIVALNICMRRRRRRHSGASFAPVYPFAAPGVGAATQSSWADTQTLVNVPQRGPMSTAEWDAHIARLVA